MRLSSFKLLKKSYSVRKIYDIFYNSPYVLVLHMDSTKSDYFKKIKNELEFKGVSIYLLNKDDFLNLPVGVVSRGSSILFYSSSFFFYDELKAYFDSNKLKFNLLYFKHFYPISGLYKNQLLNKYKFSDSQVNSFFFFSLNSYKNLFLLNSILIKKYYLSLNNIFMHKVLKLFPVLFNILEKKKLEEKNGNV